jgi:ferritin
MAGEENEHANKFMEYQNKRGGTIVLLDVKVCYYLDYIRM